MKYSGKLYGKIGRRYIPLKTTSEEVDAMKRERGDARLALLAQSAREHLTCGWCGDMMHAPPGFQPPMTTEKLKATVRLHLMDCPNHPIRETEKKLEEVYEAVRNLRNVQGRHHTQIATERLFALLPHNAIGEATPPEPR